MVHVGTLESMKVKEAQEWLEWPRATLASGQQSNEIESNCNHSFLNAVSDNLAIFEFQTNNKQTNFISLTQKSKNVNFE